ncbi:MULTISPECIES: VirK/YbjX family protein [Dickeya]|uniref:Virulence factor VirK n=1 Tax=Dickeya aquatica TaxID=1401087 RepID=A0A375ACF2_9GAMM|nr:MULTISPECIES: VirK/YbjX family protein [Dickeya]SLM63772.1 Hypothetical protein, homology with Salmonella VirK [Dickeya aquatica]
MENTSALSVFYHLLGGYFFGKKIWHKNDIKAKFLLRSLFMPAITLMYLRQIIKSPSMRRAVLVQPALPSKIHRPYLYASLRPAARADAICSHYHFVDSLANPFLKQALLSQDEYCLARFNGKNGESIAILCSASRYDKEGEATLRIRFNNVVLASLTFSVVHDHNTRAVIIGGLQGKGNDQTRELIKEASKACFGLFPKRLLLECLLTLTHLNGINTILAVGDENHVYQNLRYCYRKNKVRFSSYSEFWLSVSADKREGGLYHIPLHIARKTSDELPSRKRAQYQRRYQLLDEINREIQQTLGHATATEVSPTHMPGTRQDRTLHPLAS